MMLRAPSFEAIRWLKIADNAIDYSLGNTTKQALWLPTSREAKYKAKQAVDLVLRSRGRRPAGRHRLHRRAGGVHASGVRRAQHRCSRAAGWPSRSDSGAGCMRCAQHGEGGTVNRPGAIDMTRTDNENAVVRPA